MSLISYYPLLRKWQFHADIITDILGGVNVILSFGSQAVR